MSARLLDWAGVVLLCLVAMLAALLEMLFVPLYAGATVVPVVIVFAIAGNVLLPMLARSIVARTLAAALPFVAWLAVVIVVGLTSRPEGDVVLPGGGALQWVSYGVILGGAVAGTVTLVRLSTPRKPVGPGPRTRRALSR